MFYLVCTLYTSPRDCGRGMKGSQWMGTNNDKIYTKKMFYSIFNTSSILSFCNTGETRKNYALVYVEFAKVFPNFTVIFCMIVWITGKKVTYKLLYIIYVWLPNKTWIMFCQLTRTSQSPIHHSTAPTRKLCMGENVWRSYRQITVFEHWLLPA
jgi:hypothetical protein